MKTISVNSALVMSEDEINAYNALPDNMPDTKLSVKQKELVSNLYRKYITKIDNQDWSIEMYKAEQKENWPSGPRIKEHEAKRIILNNLIDLQRRKNDDINELAGLFHSALTCRPMYAKLVNKFFTINY